MKKYPYLDSQGDNPVKFLFNGVLALYLLVGLISNFPWIVFWVIIAFGAVLFMEKPAVGDDMSFGGKVLFTLVVTIVLILLWSMGIVAGFLIGPVTLVSTLIALSARAVLELYIYLIYATRPDEPKPA